MTHTPCVRTYSHPQDVLAEDDIHILVNAHVQANNHVGLVHGS